MNAHMNSFFVPEYVYNAGKHKMNLAGHELLRDAVCPVIVHGAF